jgi:hypothetical protein
MCDRVVSQLEQLGPDRKRTADESPLYRAFANPERITIRGYDAESLDPFITRDGRCLFFNISHFDSKRTALRYAAHVDNLRSVHFHKPDAGRSRSIGPPAARA